MQGLTKKDKEVTMKMNTEELDSTQVRLVRSIHALMASVLVADEEDEYFEASAELLKKTAELIKHSDFANKHKNISYGDQAVEFSVDTLSEMLDEGLKIHNIDN